MQALFKLDIEKYINDWLVTATYKPPQLELYPLLCLAFVNSILIDFGNKSFKVTAYADDVKILVSENALDALSYWTTVFVWGLIHARRN